MLFPLSWAEAILELRAAFQTAINVVGRKAIGKGVEVLDSRRQI
jgi:hypothetical protein